MSKYRELLAGCGSNRSKKVVLNGYGSAWKNLETADFNNDHNPMWTVDFEKLPYPFPDDHYDEIHAYELLEHTGTQGDYRFFFDQMSEFWRILKPGGILVGTTPMWNSVWAWGDPGHRRVIQKESFIFLDQDQYRVQVGKTAMSDYRFCYRADFIPVYYNEDNGCFTFALRAVKPSTWMER
jgi:SAM-dependent methyltransferase